MGGRLVLKPPGEKLKPTGRAATINFVTSAGRRVWQFH